MVSNYPNSQAFVFSHSKSRNCSAWVPPIDSLVGVINANQDFSIFSQLIKKAQYENKLSSVQANFTIFVPSNASLQVKYSKNFLDNIARDTATQIINNSMMNRILDKNTLQLSRIGKYPTLSRSNSIEISTVAGQTLINNHIQIIHFNQPASNGIIHVVSDFL